MLEYSLLTFTSMFAIVDPFAAVPAFLAMTPRDTVEARRRMALVASATSGGVLLSFAVAGPSLFRLFGITMPAFQVAGGLILLLSALDMLRARSSPLRTTEAETRAGEAKDDVAITPLAIPMLSGPGAITTAIVLYGRAETPARKAALFACIALVAVCSYAILYAAAAGAKRLNPIALSIIERLMGLMLSAIGVQFILSALQT